MTMIRNTIMFVELEKDKGKMRIGFWLQRHNLYRAPKGKIRIARFNNNFSPMNNHGYYAEIYLKLFVKKWKYITLKNKRRKEERFIFKNLFKKKICYDILNYIIQYI